MENDNKFRYFKFFFAYKEAFLMLRSFWAKRLLIALIEYAEYGFQTVKLNKKTQELFNKIIAIYEADRKKIRDFGSEGGTKRWKDDRYHKGRTKK